MAGNAFLSRGMNSKAVEYFKKALQSGSKKDVSALYFKTIEILKVEGAISESRTLLGEAKTYLGLHPSFLSIPVQQELDYYSAILSTASPRSVLGEDRYQTLLKSQYGFNIAWKELSTLIADRKYSEAFSGLQERGFKKSSPDKQVTYDVLKVLVKGQPTDVKNLLCYDSFRKKPDGYSYGIILCKLLLKYLKNGTINPQELTAAEKLIKESAPEQIYLTQAFKDLKPFERQN
jgi:hypothetical protein